MKRAPEDPNAKTVYSTDPADPVPPVPRGVAEPPAAPLKHAGTARLRLEKKGRAGKAVTVVSGLSGPDERLEGISKELKAACGAGGTFRRGPAGPEIEVQGDHRAKVEAILRKKGYSVKGGVG
ncbi:MAG TPA: translation initiation factor [Planctomycetota bacterium]|nr:translation initiation factor [Planctomycetota bacterium]